MLRCGILRRIRLIYELSVLCSILADVAYLDIDDLVSILGTFTFVGSTYTQNWIYIYIYIYIPYDTMVYYSYPYRLCGAPPIHIVFILL